MSNPHLSTCALEATIRKVRGDFYSEIPETRRIAEAMKERMVDALLLLAGSDNKEFHAIAAEIYRRFVDGTESVYTPTHEAKPASNEVRS